MSYEILHLALSKAIFLTAESWRLEQQREVVSIFPSVCRLVFESFSLHKFRSMLFLLLDNLAIVKKNSLHF